MSSLFEVRDDFGDVLEAELDGVDDRLVVHVTDPSQPCPCMMALTEDQAIALIDGLVGYVNRNCGSAEPVAVFHVERP